MSSSSAAYLPTGYPSIDALLKDLQALVGKHGLYSDTVDDFIIDHAEHSWYDKKTGIMHYFSEVGYVVAEAADVDDVDYELSPDELEDLDGEVDETCSLAWWLGLGYTALD